MNRFDYLQWKSAGVSLIIGDKNLGIDFTIDETFEHDIDTEEALLDIEYYQCVRNRESRNCDVGKRAV